jgi:hypothetical protein
VGKAMAIAFTICSAENMYIVISFLKSCAPHFRCPKEMEVPREASEELHKGGRGCGVFPKIATLQRKQQLRA